MLKVRRYRHDLTKLGITRMLQRHIFMEMNRLASKRTVYVNRNY